MSFAKKICRVVQLAPAQPPPTALTVEMVRKSGGEWVTWGDSRYEETFLILGRLDDLPTGLPPETPRELLHVWPDEAVPWQWWLEVPGDARSVRLTADPQQHKPIRVEKRDGIMQLPAWPAVIVDVGHEGGLCVRLTPPAPSPPSRMTPPASQAKTPTNPLRTLSATEKLVLAAIFEPVHLKQGEPRSQDAARVRLGNRGGETMVRDAWARIKRLAARRGFVAITGQSTEDLEAIYRLAIDSGWLTPADFDELDS